MNYKKLTGMLLAGSLSMSAVFVMNTGLVFAEAATEADVETEINAETDATDAASEDAAETEVAESVETVYPLEITDDLGNVVTIEQEPETVVSLSPSNTEILYAVGAGDLVTGRTDYCTYPEEAAEVATIGSYYSPNMELIISLAPDVVFASDYVDDEIRSQIESAGAKVIVFSANEVDAVENDILMVGHVLNHQEEAQTVVAQMETELAELKSVTDAIEEPKSVFVDLGDYYSAGTGSLLGNMLNEINAVNIADDTGELWPQLSLETIIEKNPDVYLSLYTTPEDLKAVSGLNEIDSIANDQIVFFDGMSPEGDMIQRPGPRMVEGMKLLAENIYPELFS